MSNYERYGDYSQHQNLAQNACNHTGIGIGFALLGMAAGAVIALLLAPKAGGELRGDIRRTAGRAKDRGNHLIGSVKGKVMPFRPPQQAQGAH
ncbi:MAG TPA: YtxH domain-containing protein [Terriglobales bacterium]|jgi:hypothetical protein